MPAFSAASQASATVRDDGGLDRRARDGGLPETDAFAFADHQHLVEDHFCAHVRRYLFYLPCFAGSDAILLAAGFYDRIHDGTPGYLTKEPRILSKKALSVKAFLTPPGRPPTMPLFPAPDPP